jgi:hypothetical protein
MNRMNWIGFGGLVLMAGSLMWTTTGCESSDSGSDTVTIVVTNAVGETATVELVAPQLVTPAEGQKYTTFLLFNNVEVEFTWTAVPGADSYMLYVNDLTYAVTGTSQKLSLPIGNHKWRVHAVANGKKGPLSSWVNFAVELVTIQVAP